LTAWTRPTKVPAGVTLFTAAEATVTAGTLAGADARSALREQPQSAAPTRIIVPRIAPHGRRRVLECPPRVCCAAIACRPQHGPQAHRRGRTASRKEGPNWPFGINANHRRDDLGATSNASGGDDGGDDDVEAGAEDSRPPPELSQSFHPSCPRRVHRRASPQSGPKSGQDLPPPPPRRTEFRPAIVGDQSLSSVAFLLLSK
jgi:hypothetical protein